MTSQADLRDLARAAGDLFVRIEKDAPTQIGGLCCDGHDVSSGDLFFCVDAEAHEHAQLIASRGAVATCALAPTGAGVPELIVTDVRRAMGRIAAEFNGHPAEQLTLLGVTGTNGKTTTARLLDAILAADGRLSGFIGSISARVGGQRIPTPGTTPEAPELQALLARMQRAQVNTVVLEVTSHALALERLEGMRFAASAFTNLAPDHLDFHGDMDGYFSAKRRLFAPERSDCAAVNVDDPYGRALFASIEVPAVGFGLSADADVRAEAVKLGADGTGFRLVTPHGTARIESRLIGAFNLSNCLAAAATALEAGVDLDAVESGLLSVERVPGRFELIDAGQPFAAIVDFARTPEALEAALGAARMLTNRGELTCVIGCTDETDEQHRRRIGAVAARHADHVVVTLDSPGFADPQELVEHIAEGAIEARPEVDCSVLVNRQEAITRAVARARPGDAVIVAGRGSEQHHVFLGHPVPFDDREVMRHALQRYSSVGRTRPLAQPVRHREERRKLVCLLPARDAVHDLPGYFESVGRFADAVVALDDGSLDGTREYLESQQLVKTLLVNPPRPDYDGWDDAANRNRLLAAAAELAPDWIISLDADERIPADDAAALRSFLETDALPSFAYSFLVYRMLEDEEHCDPLPILVPRLFAFEPGQRFADRRLHLQPVPISIPLERRLDTTLRIQHLASLTRERRRERFAKYVQADRDYEFQRSYWNLLVVPVKKAVWEPRPPDLPVLAGQGEPEDDFDADAPALSAIVISQNDEERIADVVRAVVEQAPPELAAGGSVELAPAADRGGVSTRPHVLELVRRISAIVGRPLTIAAGTNHHQHVIGTNDESLHWSGNAADIPATGEALLELGRAAIGAAGGSEWTKQEAGGFFMVNGVEIAFNTTIGGNHRDHLHVGLTMLPASPRYEVIVVTSGSDRTAEIVREHFPMVNLVELARPALPGEARNAGLRVARGEYVSFPGSHVELPQGSLAARLRAHELGYAMVTGTTLNGTRSAAGWASYFLDHSARLPGRPSGELHGAPITCSYDRGVLLEIGGFPEDMRTGEDTAVNLELARRGYVAYRAQDLQLVHHSPCRKPLRLVRHHFQRGRGLGRIILDDHRRAGTTVLGRSGRSLLRRWLRQRISVTSANVKRWAPELRGTYRRVYPLVVAGAIAGWVGLWYELLRPRPGKPALLKGSGVSRGERRRRRKHRTLARSLARQYDVPEQLFLALVQQESAWRADAVSRAGAIGLAQLMPATADALGVDPWDPERNLAGGVRYLREQYDRFGTWELALAAYNAGPDAVEHYGEVPPYAETVRYVQRVLSQANEAPRASAKTS